MDAPSQQQQSSQIPLPTLSNGALKSLLGNYMHASPGLVRYHSAPGPMLASLLEVGDDFSPPAWSTANQESELAQFLPEGVASPPSQFESKRILPQTQKCRGLIGGAAAGRGGGGGGAGAGGEGWSALEAEQRPGDHTPRSRLSCQHSGFKRAATNGILEEASGAPLSAILENGPEVSTEDFYGNPEIPISCGQQGARTNLCVEDGSVGESRSNLIRHSSSPAGLLSRLAMEAQVENSERSNSYFPAPLMHPSPKTRAPPLVPVFPTGNCFGAAMDHSDRLGVSSPSKSNGLLRHSSSPAGLLSQLNQDDLADSETLLLPSSSGNSSEDGSLERRGGPAFLGNYHWDENVAGSANLMVTSPNGTSFAARKRILLEDKYFGGLTLSDPQHREALEHGASIASHFNLPMSSSPENPYSPEKSSSDSVPCRTRAKRGCATHPRSIAERVRRTKISERMRKLQELVPNMDKQTNTAEMLDEAVDYVKFLQRQVQELKENRTKCDCSCKHPATSSQ